MITYKNYPALLFCSYDKDNAPDELPFVMPDTETLQRVSVSKGFQQLFSFIAVKNTMKAESNNYFLQESIFNKVEFNPDFRNEQFSSFITEYVKPKYGCILFKSGGTYVYNLLGVNDTKNLHKKDGRYISVALFKEDVFLGFEEAIITKKGVEVFNTGIYTGGMEIGGYISFCMIVLAYSKNKTSILELDSVSEKIVEL